MDDTEFDQLVNQAMQQYLPAKTGQYPDQEWDGAAYLVRHLRWTNKRLTA